MGQWGEDCINLNESGVQVEFSSFPTTDHVRIQSRTSLAGRHEPRTC